MTKGKVLALGKSFTKKTGVVLMVVRQGKSFDLKREPSKGDEVIARIEKGKVYEKKR